MPLPAFCFASPWQSWVVLSAYSSTPCQGSWYPGPQQMPNVTSWRLGFVQSRWTRQWRVDSSSVPSSAGTASWTKLLQGWKGGWGISALLPGEERLWLYSKQLSFKIRVAAPQTSDVGACVCCTEIAFLWWNTLDRDVVVCIYWNDTDFSIGAWSNRYDQKLLLIWSQDLS